MSAPFEQKICPPQQLAARLASCGRPLVFTNGVFDILHRGHVTYLAEARALGSTLLVAINGDASAQRLGKGEGHVNVTSYNYTVLLTGEVPTAQARTQVEKIVGEVPQVKTVVNELQVADASSAASRGKDAYITSKVKSNFLGAGKFKPTDVKVVTEAGVVHLLGLVTHEEADAATEVARGTAGVLKVVRVFEYFVPPSTK